MNYENDKRMFLINYLLEEKEALECASCSHDYDDLRCFVDFIDQEVCRLKLDMFKDYYSAYKTSLFDDRSSDNE